MLLQHGCSSGEYFKYDFLLYNCIVRKDDPELFAVNLHLMEAFFFLQSFNISIFQREKYAGAVFFHAGLRKPVKGIFQILPFNFLNLG